MEHSEQEIIWPRAMDRQMRKALSFSLVMVALSGCQGPLPGINGLTHPGRVPPPPTGSYQVPGSYSGATGVNAPSGVKSPTPATGTGVAPTVGSLPSGSPFVDQVASAQNQLKQATDSARSAVMQSTQNLQNQVEQASARADKMGAGVVQASQILSDSAMGALPPMPPSASGTNGSLSDQGGTTFTDPNAQWRKPTPR